MISSIWLNMLKELKSRFVRNRLSSSNRQSLSPSRSRMSLRLRRLRQIKIFDEERSATRRRERPTATGMEDRSRSRSLDDLRSLALSLSFGLPLPPRRRARGETDHESKSNPVTIIFRQSEVSSELARALLALNLPNGRKAPSSNNSAPADLPSFESVFTQTLTCCREEEEEKWS